MSHFKNGINGLNKQYPGFNICKLRKNQNQKPIWSLYEN